MTNTEPIYCQHCGLDIVRDDRGIWESKGLTPAARQECWDSPDGKHHERNGR